MDIYELYMVFYMIFYEYFVIIYGYDRICYGIPLADKLHSAAPHAPARWSIAGGTHSPSNRSKAAHLDTPLVMKKPPEATSWLQLQVTSVSVRVRDLAQRDQVNPVMWGHVPLQYKKKPLNSAGGDADS